MSGDLITLSLSAFGAGFSLALLLASVWYGRRRTEAEREYRRRVESAYRAGQRDGYGSGIVRLHDAAMVPAVIALTMDANGLPVPATSGELRQ